MREDFRRRGLGIGLVAGVVSVVALVLVIADAPRVWEKLMSLRAAPALVLGVLLAPACTFVPTVWRANLGSGQILLLLTAWCGSPVALLVYPDIDLHTAAAPAATLTFVVATLPPGMGLVLASPRLLFVFQKDSSHGVAPPRLVG